MNLLRSMIPPLVLLPLLPAATACGPSGRGPDADVEIVFPDMDSDDAGDPLFDGPGCEEYDEDLDTIPDDVEGDGDPDGDTIPNFQDEDSDGDTIRDRHEAGDFDCNTPPVDTDGDGTPDTLDLDSDGDGLLDADEAGDDNLASFPRDTDDWGTPDFRDIDSDNDGLSDSQEVGLGLDPYAEDTDGDTFPDFDEIASPSADPLDPDRGLRGDEHIYFLWYKGRSQYETFTGTAHYGKNDVFFVVDDTAGASGAAALLARDMAGLFLPRMMMELDGLRTGLGVFSGWGVSGGSIPFSCYHPFYGLATLTEDLAVLGSAFEAVPLCPEPGDGAALVQALYETAGTRVPDDWLPSMRTCSTGDYGGGACFRPDARKFVVILLQGAFPAETPAGYPHVHTMDEVTELLKDENVYTTALLVQDDTLTAPYADVAALARETDAMDRTLRPLVYLAGADGESLPTAMENLIDDLGRNPPADVMLEKVDGDDWPEEWDWNGDGEPEPYDATGFVSTVYPYGWSPPPGVAPSEAVSHIDETTYVKTIPDTEVSYRIYFRNYTLAQDRIGRLFSVDLILKNDRGLVFDVWPLKFIVPSLPGDEGVMEEE
jgi:hypothetical protein